MTTSEKTQVFMMRYDGKSLTVIANTFHVTRQNISSILNRCYNSIVNDLLEESCHLPICENFDSLTRDKAFCIYDKIAHRKHVADIKKELCVTSKEIYGAISYLCGRRRNVESQYCYELYTWLNQNRVTLKELSENIGTSTERLLGVMRGKYAMSDDLAVRLWRVTGIPAQVILQSSNQSAPHIRKYHFKNQYNKDFKKE